MSDDPIIAALGDPERLGRLDEARALFFFRGEAQAATAEIRKRVGRLPLHRLGADVEVEVDELVDFLWPENARFFADPAEPRTDHTVVTDVLLPSRSSAVIRDDG